LPCPAAAAAAVVVVVVVAVPLLPVASLIFLSPTPPACVLRRTRSPFVSPCALCVPACSLFPFLSNPTRTLIERNTHVTKIPNMLDWFPCRVLSHAVLRRVLVPSSAAGVWGCGCGGGAQRPHFGTPHLVWCFAVSVVPAPGACPFPFPHPCQSPCVGNQVPSRGYRHFLVFFIVLAPSW